MLAGTRSKKANNTKKSNRRYSVVGLRPGTENTVQLGNVFQKWSSECAVLFVRSFVRSLLWFTETENSLHCAFLVLANMGFSCRVGDGGGGGGGGGGYWGDGA